MGKDRDEDTGVTPVSTDGEGATDDELEARRRRAGGSAAARGEQDALDTRDEKVAEADDGQLFVWEQGTRVTLGTIISRGTPVKHAFVFGGKRVKGRGGLMALDEHPLLVVEGMTAKVSLVPEHDDKGKVKLVTIETNVAATAVYPADSEEAESLIAPVLASRAERRAAS